MASTMFWPFKFDQCISECVRVSVSFWPEMIAVGDPFGPRLFGIVHNSASKTNQPMRHFVNEMEKLKKIPGSVLRVE